MSSTVLLKILHGNYFVQDAEHTFDNGCPGATSNTHILRHFPREKRDNVCMSMSIIP
jgi:hypothetical protein